MHLLPPTEVALEHEVYKYQLDGLIILSHTKKHITPLSEKLSDNGHGLHNLADYSRSVTYYEQVMVQKCVNSLSFTL